VLIANGSKVSSSVFVAGFSEGITGKADSRETVCEGCQVGDQTVCSMLDHRMFAELDHIRTDKVICADEVLFEEGKRRKYVYILRKGMLRLCRMSDARFLFFLCPEIFLG